MLSERDLEVLEQVDCGDPYREVGKKHGLTPQGIGVIVKNARLHIDHIELELLRDVKSTEKMTFLAPHGEDYFLAQAYIAWVQQEFERRDVPIKVTTKQSKAGTAYQIEMEMS